MNEEMPTPKFHVFCNETEREAVDRDTAVETAKTWSAGEKGHTCVERNDGKVRMEFSDGELVSYIYETRRGRSVTTGKLRHSA